MASRTQLVCLHEGSQSSVDAVFINRLIRSLKPAWVQRWGSNWVRLEPCGGRKYVIDQFPAKLREVLAAGSNTTLMVWADVDDDADSDALKERFWTEAKQQGLTKPEFDQAVFVLAKNRIENWIEFLLTGATDESKEGPRLAKTRDAATAARKLADQCTQLESISSTPTSLKWSCKNWRALVKKMKSIS